MKNIIPGLAALILVSACALKQPVPEPDPAPAQPEFRQSLPSPAITHLDVEQRSQLYYSILLADMALDQNLLDIALDNFWYAAQVSGSAELARNAALIGQELGRPGIVLEAADIWLKEEPDSVVGQQLMVLANLSRGRVQNTDAYLLRLLELLPGEDVLQELLRIANSGDPEQVENYYRGFTGRHPGQAPVWLALAHLESRAIGQAPDPESVRQLIRYTDQALAQQPLHGDAIRMKFLWLKQLDQQEAGDFLTDISRQARGNRDLQLLIGRLHYEEGQFKAAGKQFSNLYGRDSADLEARYLYAASLYGQEEFRASLPHFRALLALDYNPGPVSYYCGDAAARIEDTDQAIQCFEAVPQGHYHVRAQRRLARIWLDLDQPERALATLRHGQQGLDWHARSDLLFTEIQLLIARQEYSTAELRLRNALQDRPLDRNLRLLSLRLQSESQGAEGISGEGEKILNLLGPGADRRELILTAAQLLHEKQAPAQAIDLLDQALQQSPDDTALLYGRAMLREPLGQITEMEADLRRILTLEPDHIDAQNALGYTLADENRNLEEAYQLILTAFRQKPDNAAYLDSMGWISYRRGELDKALQYLKQAFVKMPNAEIAAHLGELYWQLGKADKAREIWDQALQREPDNRYILRTMERLDGQQRIVTRNQ